METIDKIKQMIADGVLSQDVAEKYFPEIKKYKDEIVKKQILDLIRQHSVNSDRCIMENWICTHAQPQPEQCEQKPLEPNDISIRKMVDTYRCTEEYDEDGNNKGKPVNCMIRAYEQGIKDVLKVTKRTPTAKWSEEDEKNLQAIQISVDRCIGKWQCCGEVCPISEEMPWLKSLRHQKHWKPSDEQMKVLNLACNDALGKDYHNMLRFLYHELKAL